MSKENLSRFSLSAQTPLGFVTRLGSLCDPDRFERVLLLKGGTARARSRLIGFAASAAQAAGHCVCRVDSAVHAGCLEAAFWDNAAVLDACAPYFIEPRYPGALETVVWLGGCYDETELLAARKDIIALTDRENELQAQARRFLNAADSLLGDNRRMALHVTDTDKIKRQAARMGEKLRGDGFFEQPCILSDCFGESFGATTAPIESIVLLQDEHRAASELFLKELYLAAKQRGCRITAGYSPFSPFERLEQLIFPELSIAVITESRGTMPSIEPQRIINARRFTDSARLMEYKNRIGFNKKAARQMLSRSKELFEQAGRAHEALDEIYSNSLDGRALDMLCEDCAEFILKAGR